MPAIRARQLCHQPINIPPERQNRISGGKFDKKEMSHKRKAPAD
jgi:hypothetical protein